MLYGWGVKTGWLFSYMDKSCGWHVKLCDPSLTRANLSAYEYRTHYVALYNVLFTY